jgi:outer membrane immunogenic protein
MTQTTHTMMLAGAVLLLANQALADGLPGKRSIKDAPAVCCEANWDGLTVGVGVGVSVFINRQSDIQTPPPPPPPAVGPPPPAPPPVVDPFDGLAGRGYLGTINIGYDRLVAPGLLIGILADYDFADAEFTHSNNLVETIKLGDSWSVGGRVGLVRSCCTLWYLSGGYVSAEFKYQFTDVQTFSHKARVDGWFVGIGVEQQIGRGLALKLEYRYSEFQDDSFSFVDVGGTRHDMRLEPELHTVRLGVTYRFDFGRDRYVAPLK